MNSKIAINKIAAELAAKRVGKARDYETLLKAFFSQIEESLLRRESVRVRGFGTFKISHVEPRKSVDVSSGNDTEIPAHQKVVFLPAKELASAVNAPFEMFETIELEDEVNEEDLMQAEAEGDTLTSQVIAGNMMLEHEKFDEEMKELTQPEPESEPESEPEPEAEPEAEPEVEAEAEEEPESEPEQEAEVEPEIVAENGDKRKKSTFGHGFVWGIVASLLIFIAGIAALYLLNNDFAEFSNNLIGRNGGTATAENLSASTDKAKTDNEIKTAELSAEADMLDEEAAGVPEVVEDVVADNPENAVPTKPSDPIIYDTISKTHYLTTMAKKHYGNYHLWPYIYKENERILGHPDRIRPGTRVVIPRLSKYGVDPNNPEDIAKAKKLGNEIYARYK